MQGSLNGVAWGGGEMVVDAERDSTEEYGRVQRRGKLGQIAGAQAVAGAVLGARAE